jgi:endonuclease/exonuclease/phosphatase family metal-dependent hydrolase
MKTLRDMKTLREVVESVHPPGEVSNLEGLATLLGVKRPISLRQVLMEGTNYRRITLTPLSFLQQNLGLFPQTLITFPIPGIGKLGVLPLYKGSERSKILPTLIQLLRSERPDVVGFSEFWVDSEQNELLRSLTDLYSHHIRGPRELAPRAVELEQFNGGLLLMSKHPIVDSHQTVYRQCAGEDCFTNKGALHARIAVTGHPRQYDVFLTHMQSCPPEQSWMADVGPGDCLRKLREFQVLHLRDFIQAYSSPDRPALLMGDLNHDGRDSDVYSRLVDYLELPIDLWLSAGDGSAGITSDSAGSFQKDRGPRPIGDPERHKNGSRLDYSFSWPGSSPSGLVSPLYSQAQIVQWQTSAGRDLSDHYGLRCQLRCVREFEVDPGQPIQRITIGLAGLRCLRETTGPIPVASEVAGSDEIELTIGYGSANGKSKQFDTSEFGDIDSGDYVSISRFNVDWDDPGEWMEVSIKLVEVDKGPGGTTTGSASLGTRILRMGRLELLRYRRQGVIPRTLPIFHGDGGEYAATVHLSVE